MTLPDRRELVGALVREDRLEEALDARGAFEEAGRLLVRQHELVAHVLQGLDPLELAQGRDVVEVDVARLAEAPDLLDGVAEGVDERVLLLDREHGLAEGSGAGVDRERLVQVAEDADVVDDQPVVLAGEDAVGPRDRLHQRVVAHRLVEIDRRARRHVEAGHPHGAHEHDAAAGPAASLNLLVQVLLDHPLADAA